MIKILRCSEKPLSLIGEVASFCWNSKPSKDIGIKCLKSNHGRTLEYPDVIISIEGYSARMIRELYTTMVGVSKLQASTRYIDYADFEFYLPEKCLYKEELNTIYTDTFDIISKKYKELLDKGMSKEDAANILPLGMFTKVALKINLRAILYLFELRMCLRAYKEFRNFMFELKVILCSIDEEWKYIIENFAKVKCVKQGTCFEEKSCEYYKTENFKKELTEYTSLFVS